MKTITRSVLVAFFVCGGIFSASAQTEGQREFIRRHTDVATVKALAEQYSKEFQENYQRALELARQNNWPLTIDKPDGGFSELVGVDENDRPKYYTTSNNGPDGSARTSRVDRINTGGSAGLQLDGQNMLAGVWDGGKPVIKHVDFLDSKGVSRVEGLDSGKTNVPHATHVMGTILGSGSGNFYARGMAPEAKGLCADWTDDLGEMGLAVANHSLLVSNHSYGLDVGSGTVPESKFGAYQKEAFDLDKLLYASPYYQPVWAAGNDRGSYNTINPDGGGYDLLTQECTAKNVIVVAAVQKVNSYVNAGSVVMSTFSNWGPTDDYRIKPDICAKGVDVFSTTASGTSTTSYETMSGTSMASPGVAGALLLFQQHYNDVNGVFMRSATLRGLMAHTAEEAGAYAGPDPKFGWGLINAEKAVKTISNTKGESPKSIVDELILNPQATYTRQVYATGNEPLTVTASWTDKEGIAGTGSTTYKVLVNDLDVRVTKDGVTSFPWRLDSSVPGVYTKPAKKDGDNNTDNIEKIVIPNTVPGVYTITVTHKGTSLAGGLQNFSLIVTGIDEQMLGFEKSEFKEFNVWPNPVNDLLNVSIQSDLSSDAFVTLYDIQGRRVVDQKLNASNAMFEGSLNIGSLSSGIYVVKVSQGNKQSVRKIVKK